MHLNWFENVLYITKLILVIWICVEKDAAKKYTRSEMEIDILFGILCEGVLNIAIHLYLYLYV